MTGILIALVLLGSVVFVHELGHYLAARSCGVKVLTFSIGFGPRLASVQRVAERDGIRSWRFKLFLLPGKIIRLHPHRGVTIEPLFDLDLNMLDRDEMEQYVKRVDAEWQLCLIPVISKVVLLSPTSRIKAASWTLSGRPLWQRLSVILAGPAVNLVMAAVIITAVLTIGVTTPNSVVDEPAITHQYSVGQSALIGTVLVAGTPVIVCNAAKEKISEGGWGASYVGIGGISKTASTQASQGWLGLGMLFAFLFSVLGWLSLLPIPPLDGAQALRTITQSFGSTRLKPILNSSFIFIGSAFVLVELSFFAWSSLHDLLLWLTN